MVIINYQQLNIIYLILKIKYKSVKYLVVLKNIRSAYKIVLKNIRSAYKIVLKNIRFAYKIIIFDTNKPSSVVPLDV
jgi:hypothetical protein